MGIWQHINTVTTTEVSPDLGELAEILDDVSVEMIRLPIVEAVEPFKLHPTSKSYIYIRCLYTLNSCGWAYDSTFTPLPPQMYPQIWESWLKS
jgi:hypothetical protein